MGEGGIAVGPNVSLLPSLPPVCRDGREPRYHWLLYPFCIWLFRTNNNNNSNTVLTAWAPTICQPLCYRLYIYMDLMRKGLFYPHFKAEPLRPTKVKYLTQGYTATKGCSRIWTRTGWLRTPEMPPEGLLGVWRRGSFFLSTPPTTASPIGLHLCTAVVGFCPGGSSPRPCR